MELPDSALFLVAHYSVVGLALVVVIRVVRVVPPPFGQIHEFLEKTFGCSKVVGVYGLGEGLFQIMGGGPIGFVLLAPGGVLLATTFLEPVDHELIGTYAGLQVNAHR
ncbi:hypothetical protein SZN_00055 [Streptomyces zinciresistens K42]|uniref:Uncharacterized protein n=1 Tax=Streptomyces zinciresistens K42 TaxID=700597 RepID=G2G3G0_9ACTN|nr:hypothetical protein SZN_00055 [Streptomyces zinciresistens K42]